MQVLWPVMQLGSAFIIVSFNWFFYEFVRFNGLSVTLKVGICGFGVVLVLGIYMQVLFCGCLCGIVDGNVIVIVMVIGVICLDFMDEYKF